MHAKLWAAMHAKLRHACAGRSAPSSTCLSPQSPAQWRHLPVTGAPPHLHGDCRRKTTKAWATDKARRAGGKSPSKRVQMHDVVSIAAKAHARSPSPLAAITSGSRAVLIAEPALIDKSPAPGAGPPPGLNLLFPSTCPSPPGDTRRAGICSDSKKVGRSSTPGPCVTCRPNPNIIAFLRPANRCAELPRAFPRAKNPHS